MLYREDLEKREYEILDPRATKAAESKGRLIDEEQCKYRTVFQRDRDRIVHSKSFRRLMHKTQVFLAPDDDHYRTRLTHTLEVAQVSRSIARILKYNEDLCEAIALGHDLGHTPFGHTGENVLNSIHPGGFQHNVQSLRIVEKLEPTATRRGLNLSYEVRDGILNHRGSGMPITLEGQIVRYSDRIAYINHDIDDALRSDILDFNDLPRRDIEILGITHSERINNLIVNLCETSAGKDSISLSPEFEEALLDLRSFMFKNVYLSEKLLAAADNRKVASVIESLYNYYSERPEEMPSLYRDICNEEGIAVAVKDLVSGMTDRYAINKYKDLFVPNSWK